MITFGLESQIFMEKEKIKLTDLVEKIQNNESDRSIKIKGDLPFENYYGWEEFLKVLVQLKSSKNIDLEFPDLDLQTSTKYLSLGVFFSEYIDMISHSYNHEETFTPLILEFNFHDNITLGGLRFINLIERLKDFQSPNTINVKGDLTLKHLCKCSEFLEALAHLKSSKNFSLKFPDLNLQTSTKYLSLGVFCSEYIDMISRSYNHEETFTPLILEFNFHDKMNLEGPRLIELIERIKEFEGPDTIIVKAELNIRYLCSWPEYLKVLAHLQISASFEGLEAINIKDNSNHKILYNWPEFLRILHLLKSSKNFTLKTPNICLKMDINYLSLNICYLKFLEDMFELNNTEKLLSLNVIVFHFESILGRLKFSEDTSSYLSDTNIHAKRGYLYLGRIKEKFLNFTERILKAVEALTSFFDLKIELAYSPGLQCETLLKVLQIIKDIHNIRYLCVVDYYCNIPDNLKDSLIFSEIPKRHKQFKIYLGNFVHRSDGFDDCCFDSC